MEHTGDEGMNEGQKTKKFGIGIAGCGNISDTHADAVSALKSCKLVGACTRNPGRLDTFCNKYSLSGFTSYDEFLDHPGLDIVSVCTPTGTHLDYGKMAAKAGKHVIVEKPIEITVDRGRSLVDACRQNDVKLAVIYQNRFIDEVVRMKQMLDQGELGDVFMVSASVKWFRDQQYYSESNWRGTFKLDGGGVVINQSVHTVDLLQWLVGDVESIYAFTGTFTHENIEAEDNAVAAMKFKNGTIGVFEASTSIDPPRERKIEMNGTAGTLILEGDNFFLKTAKTNEKNSEIQSKPSGAAGPLDGLTYKNHLKQYAQIISAISSNSEPVVSGEESLKSLAVVEALYQSANNGKPVLVDDILVKSN